MTATQKRQFWRDHMTQWQDSRMTQLAYCRQHQLCPHKFGYYKRTLDTTATQSKPDETASTGFVSVQVLPQVRQPEPLTLHFDNGIRLSGIADDNLGLVKQLVQVLS